MTGRSNGCRFQITWSLVGCFPKLAAIYMDSGRVAA